MSAHELQKIKSEFDRLGLHPTYLEHEPVITSEDAAKTRGFALKQGIKALLFTNGNGAWVIVNVPGDKKVVSGKVATQMKWSKRDIRMATPDEVLDMTGCEIGSVPPFGHKSDIPLLVDMGVFDNTTSAFNIGLRTHSVLIPTDEMKALFSEIGAFVGEFAKSKE